ncbi:cell division protein FtsQ/DivIB [Variovorax terrae]|uniref:Cell division protein FtsQ n=1 Tax=Variovorax terrae TaxID=2923278 RepID=A0A9X1VRC8_9BURK|nr:cell division protein FtsQ/DivIB [Variovorax terrae]MCJ0761980.1 cell division protein FtsQ/DivIB [Variovorax terrae]
MTQTLPAPFDVKLMNMVATTLFLACVAMALAAVVWWALRNPVFAIGGITVQGEVAHNNAVTLRANVAPRLAGNFFTADLAQVRAIFESVPWVRHAVVRREFPNRLDVTLQEHQPVAYWGADGESRLVNSFGEVFEANVDEVEADELPHLSGPDGQAAQVLAMYRVLKPLFAPLDATVEELDLSGRGGWRVQLDSGAAIELGRGSPGEVAARVQRFTHTLTQVVSKYGRKADSLEAADLRHADGYALRLRGVTTVGADARKK